jgi:hypothetical protein
VYAVPFIVKVQDVAAVANEPKVLSGDVLKEYPYVLQLALTFNVLEDNDQHDVEPLLPKDTPALTMSPQNTERAHPTINTNHLIILMEALLSLLSLDNRFKNLFIAKHLHFLPLKYSFLYSDINSFDPYCEKV